MAKFLGNFQSVEDVAKAFSGTQWYDPEDRNDSYYAHRFDAYDKIAADLEGATILLAWYGPGSYCGRAFVLYEKDGELRQVEGSHCSCYALEGLWEPSKTHWKVLSDQLKAGHLFGYGAYDHSDDARLALAELVDAHFKE